MATRGVRKSVSQYLQRIQVLKTLAVDVSHILALQPRGWFITIVVRVVVYYNCGRIRVSSDLVLLEVESGMDGERVGQ